jgi:hypothetical protein
VSWRTIIKSDSSNFPIASDYVIESEADAGAALDPKSELQSNLLFSPAEDGNESDNKNEIPFKVLSPPSHVRVRNKASNPNANATVSISSETVMNDDAQIQSDSLENLEIFRRSSNNKQPPSCDPNTNIYPCGSLEFIGCSGNKKYYAESLIRVSWGLLV